MLRFPLEQLEVNCIPSGRYLVKKFSQLILNVKLIFIQGRYKGKYYSLNHMISIDWRQVELGKKLLLNGGPIIVYLWREQEANLGVYLNIFRSRKLLWNIYYKEYKNKMFDYFNHLKIAVIYATIDQLPPPFFYTITHKYSIKIWTFGYTQFYRYLQVFH